MLEKDIGHIYHSLKHSKIRDDIFNLVYDKSQELSVREIATTLGYPEKNVVGALIGDKTRYKKEDSLVGIGIMEYREYDFHGYPILLFSITEAGQEIKKLDKLKDYAHDTKEPLTNESTPNNDSEEGATCK